MSDEQKAVGYLKRALVDLNETRQQLKESESRLNEPIAIVGMSCRYPGGICSAEDLWELVSSGSEGVSGFPEDRGWDPEMLRSQDSEQVDFEYKGGFIDASSFDAEFFGIDEREALAMDPQQRVFLETAWEACENAGIDPSGLRGTSTGVFAGLSVQSYGSWLLGSVFESPEGYITSGNAGSMTSGRVAHILGLEGPAVTLDTACSSSAMALHLACQSLRLRECSLAITGGVTIMSTPWMYIEFSRQSLFPLSTESKCKSYADSADGAAFSEGVGVVVLERLSDAQRLGHDVLAVVRGSAVNQDGVSNGLTAPNGLAHERVIRKALAAAGVAASQVDALEGHGMGTVLGDPIEAQALQDTYGKDRDGERPVWLGSIKSNIGHTQAASTVAGVIKMVMAMRHEQLPATLHVDAPSRHVNWAGGAVSLLVEPVPWPKSNDVRRAAVHAFGISGTNVHIILEEAPASTSAVDDASQPAITIGMDVTTPWVLSGHDQPGLRRQAARLVEFVTAHPELEAADIARALARSRPALSHRTVLVGAEREQLLDAVRGVAEGRTGPDAITGVVTSARQNVALVLAAGGERWQRPATALLRASPAFAREIDLIEATLSPLVDWSLCEVLHGDAVALERPGVARVVDFAVAVSLARMWLSCGIKPAAVVSHGLSDIAAAHVAGALSLEHAVRAVASEDGNLSVAVQPEEMLVWSTSTGAPLDLTQLGARGHDGGSSDPVKLDEAIGALLEQGCDTFVEASPEALISEGLRERAIVVGPPGAQEDPAGSVATSLARLWVGGIAVDWAAALGARDASAVRLPTYAFDRRHFWPEQSPIWEPGGVMGKQHFGLNGSDQAELHRIGPA